MKHILTFSLLLTLLHRHTFSQDSYTFRMDSSITQIQIIEKAKNPLSIDYKNREQISINHKNCLVIPPISSVHHGYIKELDIVSDNTFKRSNMPIVDLEINSGMPIIKPDTTVVYSLKIVEPE